MSSHRDVWVIVWLVKLGEMMKKTGVDHDKLGSIGNLCNASLITYSSPRENSSDHALPKGKLYSATPHPGLTKFNQANSFF